MFSIQKSKFEEIITETMQTSVENVGRNKFRNMEISVYGSAIVKLSNVIMKDTQAMTALTNLLCEPFYKVFNSEPKPDVNTKEAIFMNYYDQTLDIMRPLTELLTNMHGPDIPARQFAAALLRQLLQDMIAKRSAMYETTAAKESETVSENEQSVLFYLSGFLIHALGKRVKRLKPDERQATYDAIDRMKVQKDEKSNSLAKKFSTWTDKLNRGGLKIPSEDMFLLVREMESQSRNVAMCDLTTRKEILMDKFMIKYYSERMMSGKYCSSILERVLSIFLTIRGNAVARKTKLALNNKTRDKALRKSLKEKNINY